MCRIVGAPPPPPFSSYLIGLVLINALPPTTSRCKRKGPVCVHAALSPEVALAVGERLVTGTLYEVLYEAGDTEELRLQLPQVVGAASASTGAGKADIPANAQRPHVLLLQYPGGSGGLLTADRIGAKRKKVFMKELLQVRSACVACSVVRWLHGVWCTRLPNVHALHVACPLDVACAVHVAQSNPSLIAP